ncbi:polyribonucleotide nucleotidyltransferase [bacterium]|nr:polyribonucleotide nucleotidyltransferase [bacterium]
MAIHRTERQIGGQTLTIETGKLAKQAHGAVTVQYGDTMALVTAVSGDPWRVADFLLLSVEYREKFHAAGKIPGGRFHKREGRPSQKEILTARMIDRPIRPLFPKGFGDEVQVYASILSADRDNDPDICAMVGASAALAISPIPFQEAIGACRVGFIEGKYVINPTFKQVAESELDLVMAATKAAVVMVEAGANEVQENVLLDALKAGHEACREVIEMIEELVAEIGVEKRHVEPTTSPEALMSDLTGRYLGAVTEKLQIPVKADRSAALGALKDQIKDEFAVDKGEEPDYSPAEVKEALHELERIAMRALIASGTRCDGRTSTEIRPITCDVSFLPRTHGSAVFTRGETQALVAATLGTSMDEEWVETLQDDFKRRFMLHYNFPAFSVGECRPERGPGRREIGHGALAARAFLPVLPTAEEFPYTIRIVSDILESNGSSSMASICGATLSMMDAGVPIHNPIAGIAMGLLKEGDEYIVLTDILGDEDHHGDMDFKVAGTQHGVTALQMDIKIGGIPDDVLSSALDQAKDARISILRTMLATLDQPRDEISPLAPRLLQIQINPSKIGAVIGPGGKVIRNIEEVSGARVEIEDSGVITISSPNKDCTEKARDMIQGLTAECEIGHTYDGRVVSTKNFGAFIEILPGQEGLCHISELADKYVEKVEDVMNVGDRIRVKVINIDDQGRVKLSRKAVLREEKEEESK